MIVIGTPDHEAHVAVPRGPSHQKAVHEGDMIGYQQSAALRGHIAGAQHPDAVQGRDQAADAKANQSQRYHRNSVSREAPNVEPRLLNGVPAAAYPLDYRLALRSRAQRG